MRWVSEAFLSGGWDGVKFFPQTTFRSHFGEWGWGELIQYFPCTQIVIKELCAQLKDGKPMNKNGVVICYVVSV